MSQIIYDFPQIINVSSIDYSKDLITTKVIEELLDYQEELFSDSISIQNKFHNGGNDQLILEEKILSEMTICPIQKLKSDPISFLNTQSIDNLVSNQYFNPKVMESIMCLTDTILYMSPDPSKNKHLRNWFYELKQFGDNSGSGYALKGSLKGSPNYGWTYDISAKDIFVVKAPKNERANNELIHEAFVGLTSLNYLRDYIPNFTFIYGLFKCSAPVIDRETKEVITWCQEKGNTNYLLMENIDQAVSFYDFVVTSTLEDFVSLYLQTLYAIRTGYLKCDFTHYDLHSKNVLIRDIPIKVETQKVAIPYDTENGLEYWIGSKIATIIDYGRVHVQYEGKNYGFWEYPEIYIYPDRSYLLYDAYKLLGYLLGNIKVNNPKIFKEASKILNFFNTTEDKSDFLRESSRYYHILPLTEKISEKTLDDLLIYIRSIYDCSSFISSDPQNYPVLTCQNDSFCLTQTEIIKEFKDYIPDDIWKLCDMIKRIKEDSNEKEDYLNIINNLNIEEILLDTESLFNNFANFINQHIYRLSISDQHIIHNIPMNSINRYNLTRYRSYISRLIIILQQFKTLLYMYESYDCVIKFYNKPIYEQSVNRFKNRINYLIKFFNFNITNLLMDINYIEDLKKINLNTLNKNLEWVLNKVPTYKDFLISLSKFN